MVEARKVFHAPMVRRLMLLVALARWVSGANGAETIESFTSATMANPQEWTILTPKPDPAPRVNGPTIYGCWPSHPFLYRIPATGNRPMAFSVEGLPEGLALDPATGIITGTVPPRGEYKTTLMAKNNLGESSRLFRIVSGDKLALTPPMGWNDYYAHTRYITDPLMRDAADVMVSSGMADSGYQYVNIDGCWMMAPKVRFDKAPQKEQDPLRLGEGRDAQGNILPNAHFPDMNALTQYIHSKGLKAGIYSSPGPLTCGGYTASYEHEAQDARQFADWGFDFLKYDWCSYRVISGIGSRDRTPHLEARQKPYRLMGGLIAQQKRDMVFNLCQYGMGSVWEWGAEVGGQSWRTAADFGGKLNTVFEVALANAEHGAWSGPGSWNDPDYLMIGYKGATPDSPPRRFTIAPNTQYAYMSLWCLMASPLFYSGDMSRLDDFTLNVLCNPEVIEVDQDALGKSADVLDLTPDSFVMVKAMEDGSKAVGLFNRSTVPKEMSIDWSELGLSGKQIARDLWRQQDLGTCEGKFEALAVPARGVVLVRLRPAL